MSKTERCSQLNLCSADWLKDCEALAHGCSREDWHVGMALQALDRDGLPETPPGRTDAGLVSRTP
jgi:hypothetical protein